jgi:hypothetical protein
MYICMCIFDHMYTQFRLVPALLEPYYCVNRGVSIRHISEELGTHPDHGCSEMLWNVSTYLPDYTLCQKTAACMDMRDVHSAACDF